MNNSTTNIRNIIRNEPGISASEIASRLNLSQGRVSQIIKYLRDNEVVEQRREGRSTKLHPTSSDRRRDLLRNRWR